METSLFDMIENPRHSTKKELRPPGSLPKVRPPRIATKRNISRSLFGSKPLLLLNNDNICTTNSVYDETLNLSYYDQCFEEIEKIGEGSFGEVYKVRSRVDGAYYAMKRSKDCYRGDRDRADKIAEVNKYESIPYHNNIIRLINAWEQDDYVYIQMELGCTSLEQFAEDNHNIPEKHLWNVLLDMLLALKHLHDHNFIHLDVKLENIILCEDGTCKLVDFGLLMNVKGDLRKAMEGDPKYLPCELMDSKFTKAADVFSLGISMLELASDLELPRDGKLWHNLRNGSFPDHMIKFISQELLNIIRRMMIKDYKKRPSVKCLLKHPRLKSLLKQRREAAANGVNLDGRLTPPVIQLPLATNVNSTPPNRVFPLNETFTNITPPLGHSTPNMQFILKTFESSLANSTNEEFQTADEASVLMDTSDEDDDDITSYETPILPHTQNRVSRNISLYSSAKRLNFVYDN